MKTAQRLYHISACYPVAIPLCHIRKMPTCPSPQAVPSRTVSLRSTGLRLSQDFSTPVS